MSVRRWQAALSLVAVVAVLWGAAGRAALAQAIPADSQLAEGGATPRPPSAPPPSAPPAEPPSSPEIVALHEHAARIRALIANTLELTVEPASLFTVNITDERAIGAEVRRLRAIIAAALPPVPAADAGAGGEAGDGGAPAKEEEKPEDPYYTARLELDRATLSFLVRPKAERGLILARHDDRRADASSAAQRRAEAERQKREAEAARRRALQAAEDARSEVLRRVAREQARLNGMQSAHADKSAELHDALDELREHGSDPRLLWESEVEVLLARSSATSAQHDALYDRLVAALARSHKRFSESLVAFSTSATTLVDVGADPLTDLGEGVDLSAVEALRQEVIATHDELERLEDEVVTLRARLLMAELTTLRSGRLALLPHISKKKREQIFGFGAIGRAQAEAELSQAGAVLVYHFSLTRRWLRELDLSGHDRERRLSLYWQAFKVFSAFIIFIWWHRRSKSWLGEWQEKVRAERPRSRSLRWLRFLSRVRSPAEWLLLFWVVRTLLPASIAGLLEVQIVETVLIWMLGESLVVDAIDALVAQRRRSQRDDALGKIRLRALRLVGRVVVLFGLALSLSARLTGEGTVYHWVWRGALYAALPVTLVLVYWYKPHIFHRLGQRRKQSGLSGWVHDHKKGWLSFPAALVGAVYLLLRGTTRVVRAWVGGFELSRRALAYWFRRELTKKVDEQTARLGAEPLGTEKRETLDPERVAAQLIGDIADDPQVARMIACIDAPSGGVFAVVGERGSGKSTLLRRIVASCHAELVACPFSGQALLLELRQRLALPDDATEQTISDCINRRTSDTAILIDDAQHLVRPCIGGLDDFDALVKLARESSATTCTWVFALDTVIWQLIQRARGAKPLFDDVLMLRAWSEEEIAQLLTHRSSLAAIAPRFDKLLTDLPEDADDVDRQDALVRAETNYYRLLWDYADGNPAVALHFWRESLGSDAAGSDWVHLFKPPSTADIERLPDEAVFVLRAVVQLERAAVDDIIKATMLSSAVVHNALRYALARGYVEVADGRYRLAWQWFRAVTNFLTRRHLLVGRNTT